MKEQRGQFARIADTIAGTMRRRQQGREPRVLLYDANGRPQLVPPGEAHAAVLEVAVRLVALGTSGPEEEAAE